MAYSLRFPFGLEDNQDIPEASLAAQRHNNGYPTNNADVYTKNGYQTVTTNNFDGNGRWSRGEFNYDNKGNVIKQGYNMNSKMDNEVEDYMNGKSKYNQECIGFSISPSWGTDVSSSWGNISNTLL